MLLNLIKHQLPEGYLYVKDTVESKCELLINGREKEGIKTIKNLQAFIYYSQTTDV